MDDRDFYWLVGLLEGEGSFLFPPPSSPMQCRIALQMTDEDVVRRAAALMGINYVCRSHRNPNKWKPTFKIDLKGASARELMARLLPFMGARRSQRIREVLAKTETRAPGWNYRKLSDAQVVEILERCGTGESTEEIGRSFGISGRTVRQIRARKKHRRVSAKFDRQCGSVA